jgi:hypothetical protein
MAICLFVVGGLGFRATLPGAALVALTCIWTAAYALSAGPLGEYPTPCSLGPTGDLDADRQWYMFLVDLSQAGPTWPRRRPHDCEPRRLGSPLPVPAYSA